VLSCGVSGCVVVCCITLCYVLYQAVLCAVSSCVAVCCIRLLSLKCVYARLSVELPTSPVPGADNNNNFLRSITCAIYGPWQLLNLHNVGNEWGWSVGRMILTEGERSAGRNPVQLTLCPPQIPHTLAWD
jgi:hypothetical protein